jgi:hypothetical protein
MGEESMRDPPVKMEIHHIYTLGFASSPKESNNPSRCTPNFCFGLTMGTKNISYNIIFSKSRYRSVPSSQFMVFFHIDVRSLHNPP